MFSRLSVRSVRTKLIAPPIQVYGVSGSYAAAAYSAAVKSGEQVKNFLRKILPPKIVFLNGELHIILKVVFFNSKLLYRTTRMILKI